MEKSSNKVLLSALDNYGGHPFNQVFDIVFPAYGTDEVRIAHELAEKVAMVIWGGADISPAIYHQKASRVTDASDVLSPKDRIEVELAKTAMELGIPIIGICRGAQLMCALSGGSLVQHVNHHAGGYHHIETTTHGQLNCPSLHHQMMHPWPRADVPELVNPIEFEMLAWSKGRSNVYLGDPDENEEPKRLEVPLEPEVVWFPHTKALCIQSHPEFIDNVNHPFVKYCLELVEKYVLKS